MFKWIRLYNNANPQIKIFIFNAVVYFTVIVITTIYCYGRLDFVRSYPSPKSTPTQMERTRP